MNQFNAIGRLAKEVDLKYTNNEIAVANSTIAINRPFKNASGEREADFLRIVAFRKTAELLSQHFTKGKQLGITGRIQSRSYDDKSGNRQFITEVVVESIHFISDGSNNQNQPAQTQNNNYGPTPNQQQKQPAQGGYEPNPFNQGSAIDINDDDLPFDLGEGGQPSPY